MVATLIQYEKLFGHIEKDCRAFGRCDCIPSARSLLNFTFEICLGWDNI